MATVSVSLPSDGQTIDAADYNTPINTIVTELNGSLDSDNIAAGGVVPNSLTTGTGTSWVWQDWTPTFSNWTVGTGGSAGTTAKYCQIGKTVFYRITSTLGTSGQSVGSAATFSLPVTAAADVAASAKTPIGFLTGVVAGTNYSGDVWCSTTTTGLLIFKVASATYLSSAGTSSTIPATWAAGNSFTSTGCYEAA